MQAIHFIFWTTAPYFIWSWWHHSGQSRMTQSMSSGACANICLTCQNFENGHMKYMHVRHGCTTKICPRITWEGNRRRCSRHRGCWGGSAAEASSFEPFDAFQLGLIHAWLLFLYMHANGITAVFQSRRGGDKVPWFAHQCCLLDFPPYSFSSSPGQLQESLWTWLSTQIQVQDIASVSQLNQICRSSQALSITGHELAYASMMRKQKFRVNKDQDFWGSKSSRKKLRSFAENCARFAENCARIAV